MIKSKRKHFALLELEKSKTSRIRKNKRMFTLIELIIVIVVIGILAGMALPKFTGVIRNSKVAAMVTDIDTLEKAIMMYQQDNDTLPLLEETQTFGLQRLSENDMSEIYTSLQETLKLSEDSEEYLYKIDLDESGKYHSKTKYGHDKTDKDFYVYSTKSNKVYYYDYLLNGENNYQHTNFSIDIEDNLLTEKKESKPLGENNKIEITKWEKKVSGDVKKIIETSDGFVSIGETAKNSMFPNGLGYKNAFILKQNKQGDILWTNTHSYSDTYSGENTFTMFNDVIQTKDQGFIALGKTNSRSIRNNWTGLIVKYDKSGNKEWVKTFNNLTAVNEIVAIGNDYIITGANFDTPKFGVLMKINEKGEILQESKKDNLNYSVIEKVNDNEFLISGNNSTTNSNFISKIDKDFNVIYTKEFVTHNSINSIKNTSDNGYIVVSGTIANRNALVIKYNKNNEEEWRYANTKYNSADYADIIELEDRYVVVGYKNESGYIDGMIINLSKNGEFINELMELGSSSGHKYYYNILNTKDSGFIIGRNYLIEKYTKDDKKDL